ncbi:MAG: Zn-dependent oligopeptidase [Candidatus Riflebacteria bacterium]|nr:Zn-dependent oligopeptidase [Candidatus Riflebacteria bacterium]
MTKLVPYLSLIFLFAGVVSGFAQMATPSAQSGSTEKVASAPPLLQFSYSVADIDKVASAARLTLDSKLEAIVKVPADARTFDNTMLALENALADYNDTVTIPQFMASVSPDKATRDAASKLEEDCSSYLVDISSRRDLYNAVNELASTSPKLASIDAFLLERTLTDFKRSGLGLPEKELNEFKQLKKKLVSIQIAFAKNLRDLKDGIEVTKEELAGLPDDYIAKLEKTKSGNFFVSLDYPEYLPFMDNAKNEDARKKIEYKFNNRCASENVALFEEALQLRDSMAKMLGYKNHAEFVLADHMARKPETVVSFLDRLREKLAPKGKEELASRLELKAKEIKAPAQKEMNAWDWRFWNNQFRKLNLELDEEKVKQYFPLEIVVPGMLGIFEEIFEVKFVKADLPVWHPDVVGYEVKDKDGSLIGYFYLDLFPRDGKYKHMACFDIRKGRRLADGSYQKPAAAIVGNFPKPSKDSPSLFSHNDVETIFHEFGHTLHNLFSLSPYESFSGTSVDQDFVEAPSTLLENWVWRPEVLKRVSGHYKNHDEKLPDDLIKRMIDNRNFDAGMFQLRQLFFSIFDMNIHTTMLKNTTDVYKNLMKDVMFIPMTDGVHPQASFGHLMGGYDAGYYGYLWARVISSDIFSEFEKNGLFDPKTGRKYRELILSKGRVPDTDAQIETFLGRKFNEDAFLRNYGLLK